MLAGSLSPPATDSGAPPPLPGLALATAALGYAPSGMHASSVGFPICHQQRAVGLRGRCRHPGRFWASWQALLPALHTQGAAPPQCPQCSSCLVLFSRRCHPAPRSRPSLTCPPTPPRSSRPVRPTAFRHLPALATFPSVLQATPRARCCRLGYTQPNVESPSRWDRNGKS